MAFGVCLLFQEVVELGFVCMSVRIVPNPRFFLDLSGALTIFVSNYLFLLRQQRPTYVLEHFMPTIS